MVSTEERTKAILAKQAEAAQRRKDSEEQAQLQAADAARIRQETETVWKPVRERFIRFIRGLNEQMNEVELVPKGPESPLNSNSIDIITITIADTLSRKATRGTPGLALRKLVVEVFAAGHVNVNMGTFHQSNKKTSAAKVRDADIHTFLETEILDFLESNTER